MATVRAKVCNGRIEMQAPVDWPEGTEVVVRPVAMEDSEYLSEEDQPESLEAIAEWLRWYDSLDPLILSDEDRAAWEAARLDQKEFEKAAFAARGEKLQRIWK